MSWFKKHKNLHNNEAPSPRQREIETAEAEHREANQAYVKAETDGASSDDIRRAEQRVQRALKHLNALTGEYQPRKRR